MYRELFSLKNKIALVVGGASGIGKAISEGFKEFGAYVIVADINEKGAREVGDEGKFVDISNLNSIKNIFKDLDKLNILLSTPGINIRKRIEEYSYEEFQKIFNINLIGQFFLAKEAIKTMEKTGGSMIFISSIRAFVIEPGQGPYSMTKGGIVQMVKVLAAELAKYNIRVNSIAPGVVDTPLTAQIKKNPKWYEAYASKTALKRWAKPSEIVGTAILLASDAGSYITGTTILVDGGWTAIDGRYNPFENR